MKENKLEIFIEQDFHACCGLINSQVPQERRAQILQSNSDKHLQFLKLSCKPQAILELTKWKYACHEHVDFHLNVQGQQQSSSCSYIYTLLYPAAQAVKNESRVGRSLIPSAQKELFKWLGARVMP